jgi:hypothetical protein
MTTPINNIPEKKFSPVQLGAAFTDPIETVLEETAGQTAEILSFRDSPTMISRRENQWKKAFPKYTSGSGVDMNYSPEEEKNNALLEKIFSIATPFHNTAQILGFSRDKARRWVQGILNTDFEQLSRIMEKTVEVDVSNKIYGNRPLGDPRAESFTNNFRRTLMLKFYEASDNNEAARSALNIIYGTTQLTLLSNYGDVIWNKNGNTAEEIEDALSQIRSKKHHCLSALDTNKDIPEKFKAVLKQIMTCLLENYVETFWKEEARVRLSIPDTITAQKTA